ncbi:MAG: nonstructural protein [Microvirus sp.]|nr:MAG: nonstructural protein [Microvirus sp.]
MFQIICSVKDRAADAFGRPLFVPSVGLALRSFTDEVNRDAPDNQMFSHSDDFDLYELGTFDDNTGIITCHASPKQLALGKQVKV